MQDIDPRVQLAGMITKAEATDGKMRLAIRGGTEPVVVQLPVLGAYSSSETDLSKLLFRWDGQVALNKPLLGAWRLVTAVKSIDAFDPGARHERVRHPIFEAATFKADGSTSEPTFIWTGHTLMDLNRYEALQMQLRTIKGKSYLFIEKGDFNGRHRFGGREAYLVYSQ